MRVRIQKTMVLILGLALLLSYGLFSFIVYYQNLNLLKSEVKQEARYIQTAVNIVGPDYLERLDNVEVNTRVTRIGADGTVLYDSGRDEKSLENHKDREEKKFKKCRVKKPVCFHHPHYIHYLFKNGKEQSV